MTQQLAFTKSNRIQRKNRQVKKENKTRDRTKIEQRSSVELKIKVINERRNRFVAYIVIISTFNTLNAELNPICYLLALLAHHLLHVSRIRVKSLTLRLLMSYIYGAPILDVSRSHTTTHHSR